MMSQKLALRFFKDITKRASAPIWLPYLLWRGHTRNKATWLPQQKLSEQTSEESNPLHDYFKNYRSGPGIWKWDHYFDIYHRHFQRFRGREVHVLEIGIYSGGSLSMWKNYFGPKCHVYGVDIEESCKAYEGDQIKIFIGNQSDRGFWKKFREQVPRIDIIIDDGGHRTDQQVITLEETLPHLQPGGVFLCEDIHGTTKGFTAYVDGLIHRLNAGELVMDLEDSERRLVVETTPFQSAIHSIHSYPFVTVIEKRNAPIKELVAPRHGSIWEPFLQ